MGLTVVFIYLLGADESQAGLGFQGSSLICTHFTYDGNEKICFLKHADTKQQILDQHYDSYNTWCAYYNGEDRFAIAKTVFLSRRTRTATTGPRKFQIDKDCEYRYNDLAERTNVATFGVCAALCFKMTRCTHATFKHYNRTCYLKHASSKEQIRETRWNLYLSWCLMYNGEERYEEPD
uniref:Apple domain-containing protein n=1 Tax=Romanomermis culicivorax TaxID=13658 RepID=A0A915K7M7_ROMCU